MWHTTDQGRYLQTSWDLREQFASLPVLLETTCWTSFHGSLGFEAVLVSSTRETVAW